MSLRNYKNEMFCYRKVIKNLCEYRLFYDYEKQTTLQKKYSNRFIKQRSSFISIRDINNIIYHTFEYVTTIFYLNDVI